MNFALIGAPGSGKSSIADALGVRMSFADGVRREVADYLLPIICMVTDGAISDEYDVLTYMTDPGTKDAFRPLLQTWGTEFRRTQDPDYWCRALEQRIVRSMSEDQSRTLVVDDCRFPNEYEMLRRKGFKFIRLESGAYTRPLTGEQLLHASEQHWPQFPVDLVLDFQPGADTQAQRILDAFEGKD